MVLSVGDFVLWNKFDEDIPEGSVGQVVSILENGRRRVHFQGLPADYNIKPEELRSCEKPADWVLPGELPSASALAVMNEQLAVSALRNAANLPALD